MRMSRSAVVVICLALIGACGRQATNAPRRAPASFAPDSLAEQDVGASMLAGVVNARAAIAAGDRLDAANDLRDALTYAEQLSGRSSSLFADAAPTLAAPTAASRPPPAGRHAHPASARLTKFAAEVELASANAALQNGDLRAADAHLSAIQAGVPPALVPANLPLLEADESLDLAVGAPSGERAAVLRYQLANAARALRTYAGPSHADDARALAAEIEAALSGAGAPEAVPPARIELWSNKIDGWT